MNKKEILTAIYRVFTPGVLVSVTMMLITVYVGDQAVTFSDKMLWVIALSVQLGIFLVELSRNTSEKRIQEEK